MPHTPQHVLVQLQLQQYAPVYWLQGDEPYYIDRITTYIEDHVLSAAEKSFNLTITYGKDTAVGQLLNQARRFPMGSTYQVVIVKEAQELSDLQREAGRQLLSNYLQSPQPATLLVFAHKHKVLDARTALSKLLAQKAIVVNTKKLQQYQVPTWIKEYVQAQHLDITEKAAWMLQEFIGNDLGRLAKELGKLQLNLGQGKCIDDSLVQAYVVGEYLKAARHYTLSQVIANIHHLHQADLQLKGINYPTTPEGQILKELIYKLLH